MTSTEERAVCPPPAPEMIRSFLYPVEAAPPAPDWHCWEPARTERTGREGSPTGDAEHSLARIEERIRHERLGAYEEGRMRGMEEGRRAEREEHAANNRPPIEAVTRCVMDFADTRDKYLQEVEQNVVRLSLAIAARILRREAQVDPLLLTGAVRVALGQVAAATRVHLYVPEAEFELWRETMALVPNLRVRPEVRVGDGMSLGECRLETELGSVDLGIRTQLQEIERAVFETSLRNEAAPPSAVAREISA